MGSRSINKFVGGLAGIDNNPLVNSPFVINNVRNYSPPPPAENNFLLLSGGDFLLLNGDNLRLLGN